ncbi:MAG: type II toxin-antitoxin system VapC family toxin [Gemmatimonadales bacterium]
MTSLVVDASVWVAAADPSDPFCQPSRAFLEAIAGREVPVALPAYAQVEVACALARRKQNAEVGRTLAAGLFAAPTVEVHALDSGLLEQAVHRGTHASLRAGDALYAALAERVEGQLVSWDGELTERAHAVTPETWLGENPAGSPGVAR